ncbi:MAG TPA: glycosyltransferase family 4 protein [Candidatus Nanoarchaeia archaeon]|nr:glycosyltransferase family 4 protein [Candidatus Nanoarchaeia archaeon]
MSKILICTGIYPPRIGGPAQYAKEIKEEFERRGNSVSVLTYGLERRLPILIRHELFFWKTFFKIITFGKDDFIIALDTASVGWPAALAAKILRKKIIIRIGGDFLWESYIERTGDLVPLRNFYPEKSGLLNQKERLIFRITRWTLKNVHALVFSTHWQKEIFEKAYGLDSSKNFVVENFYGPKNHASEPEGKIFLSGGRPIKLKNNARLITAFAEAQKVDPTIALSIEEIPYSQFIEKLKSSYAVILTSISDISPNLILEAVRFNKPFITTKETGIYERLKDVGLFINPEDTKDITEKILFLADRKNYEAQKQKIESFTFEHTWAHICNELLAIAKNTHESH